MKSFPEQIFDLEELIWIRASNIQLESLTRKIEQLRNLEVLSLDQNQLKGLPSEIGSLNNLKRLNLFKNLLTKEAKKRIAELLPSSRCWVSF